MTVSIIIRLVATLEITLIERDLLLFSFRANECLQLKKIQEVTNKVFLANMAGKLEQVYRVSDLIHVR